ncbi:LacI family DNA-binding transcriptional regulator [Lacrimispora sp.]|uniref:LacI family DNA-binding transcriptional regulator n=1 Tax=Lacrimispora sp. TaxID=2719234 RepID=UPI00345F82F6
MAEILETSTTTVSNVIHGKTGEVSPAMVEKVTRLLEEYNYIPNINARNLASNKSGIIGLAMKADMVKDGNFMKDPFAGELTGVVERVIRENGYFTMLYISNDIKEIINSVASWNADGLILQGMKMEDAILLKKRVKKPMIFVDSYFSDSLFEYANVGVEDWKGGYEITDYLIKKGHRKIAFLADNSVGVDYQRLQGYKAAMSEAGIPYKEENFIRLEPCGPDMSPLLSNVYSRAGEFTAFVCASDFYAANIMNYLQDHGVRIPEDLSVVGFDDNSYSTMVRPALTTVHQDVTRKGRLAVEKLFLMIQGEDCGAMSTQLPVYLVERDSVKEIIPI